MAYIAHSLAMKVSMGASGTVAIVYLFGQSSALLSQPAEPRSAMRLRQVRFGSHIEQGLNASRVLGRLESNVSVGDCRVCVSCPTMIVLLAAKRKEACCVECGREYLLYCSALPSRRPGRSNNSTVQRWRSKVMHGAKYATYLGNTWHIW